VPFQSGTRMCQVCPERCAVNAMKSLGTFALLCTLCVSVPTEAATSLTTGFDYSSGDYGGSDTGVSGATSFLIRMGWTLKGDIRVLDDTGVAETYDPDDPLDIGLALSRPVTDQTRVGIAYDWRQRLFSYSEDARA